ncbi:MAG: GAF domain-containing protein [Elusimicrobiaceae bacterium]|nr:GAF domain-containing protein [Elusimicrobiaceae bacterium]
MTKTASYTLLLRQLESILSMETDPVANMSNMAAVLFHGLSQINWAGFYVLREHTLVLGPFQGNPACVRIPLGKGVCGTAAQTGQTQLVANVHQFAGHIACDSASNSEIVVPVFKDGQVWGVLDIDSPQLGRFDQDDQSNLEQAVQLFIQNTRL